MTTQQTELLEELRAIEIIAAVTADALVADDLPDDLVEEVRHRTRRALSELEASAELVAQQVDVVPVG